MCLIWQRLVDGTTPVLFEPVVCPLNTRMFVSGIVSSAACPAVDMVMGKSVQVLIPRSLVALTDQIRI